MDGSRRRWACACGLAATIALAAVALVAVGPAGGSTAAAAKVKRTYRITVTVTVATETMGDAAAGNFRGTSSWTHTYPRASFRVFWNGYVARQPDRPLAGTAVARYDHSCGPGLTLHESGTSRGPSTLMFGANRQGVLGGHPFGWNLGVSSVHGAPTSGDTPTCPVVHQGLAVPIGRRDPRSTLVPSAGFGPSYVNLMFAGVKRNGRPGFPLDRLLAGKRFSFATRGTNRGSRVGPRQPQIRRLRATSRMAR